MSYQFTGKNALVTGGSSGIGLAIAKKLAALGTNVWILARNPERLDAACQEINALRVNPAQHIESLVADVSDAEQIERVFTNFANQFGGADILINSAGVTQPGMFVEQDLSVFRSMMEINYFGVVHAIKAVVPGMAQRGGGHIVNFSSQAGMFGVYAYSAYGSSKFAIRGLTDVLRYELAEKNIRLSVVFPPDTDTPQLEYEKPFKPPVLVELASTNALLTAEQVADSVINGIARGKYIITPGFESTLFYQLTNFFGLVYPVMEFMVAQARRAVARPGWDASTKHHR